MSINCGYVDIRGVPVLTLKYRNEYYLIKSIVMALLGEEPHTSTTRVFPADTKTIKLSNIYTFPKPITVNGNSIFIECEAVINALLTRINVSKAKISEIITHKSNPNHIKAAKLLIPLIRVTEPEILTLERIDTQKILRKESAKLATLVTFGPAPQPPNWKMSLGYICEKRKLESDDSDQPNKRQKNM